jgi:hypothetical protein
MALCQVRTQNPAVVGCFTHRFGSGATVRLAPTATLAGYAPSWSGCDSVEGPNNTCIVTMTGEDRVFQITPVAQ